MLDILTFYQERLANESYLRTATQLDSLTQLSRLIGYQPSPGIAASTYLAFTHDGSDRPAPGPGHRSHHHSGGHAGTERSRARTDTSVV